MNGNQGLEALAALCGGESAAATNADSGSHGKPETSTAPAPPSPAHQHQPSPPLQMPRGTESLTSQQWQQAVAAAAALGANGGAHQQQQQVQGMAGLTAQSLALLSAAGLQPAQLQQQQPKPNVDSNAALAAMQQLAYFRYFQDQQAAAQNNAANLNPMLHANPQALALALAGQGQQLQQHLGDATGRQQVLPPAAAPSSAPTHPESSSSSVASMPPPPVGQTGSLPSTLSTAGIGTLSGVTAAPAPTAGRQHTAIAPLPNPSRTHGGFTHMAENNDAGSGGEAPTGDKKLQKRAANRRSAQLSRKRKKQFIEELKDENDELRRKEQILRSIPDLIVVFDSTGKLWFVSQSVSRFMNLTADELEGTSFWDRLCEDSVRLLKAAFMDSLAARTDDSDTAPLGSGIWELRLVDKDGSHKVVTLNGVVHFSGDRPECVCSIRPRDDPSLAPSKRKHRKTGDSKNKSESLQAKTKEGLNATNDGNESSANIPSVSNDDSAKVKVGPRFQPLMRAKPQQSVISSSSNSSGASNEVAQKVKAAGGKRREAARISDGDSGSADSGSSDELGE